MITIVHGNPADVVLGIENVASIWVAVSHVTDVATILAEPVCVNLTVGVETKPAPVMISDGGLRGNNRGWHRGWCRCGYR